MAAESEAEALRRAFVKAGLDPTGIDLAWLAAFKIDTEHRIAVARSDPAFASALPVFAPRRSQTAAQRRTR